VSTSVLWFRRDLRLHDHPALLAAADAGTEVLGVFVLDDALWAASGEPRRAFLAGCLADLGRRMGGRLVVVRGEPAQVVPRLAAEVGATSVHVSADHGPYGRERDERVAKALGEVPLVRTGSPYAVAPGRVTKSDGEPYRVYTPFYRAWVEHGWRRPAAEAEHLRWSRAVTGEGVPSVRLPAALELPEPGEEAGLARWEEFAGHALRGYGEDRNRPDRPGTSRMSPYLRWGCVHPRTLLATLSGRTGTGAEVYRKELAWREFYADVLWHHPDSARTELQQRWSAMRWDTDDSRFEAWAEGRTGYPIVDGGMRQLLREGWMHNRLRMITASFLVKDLHLDWRRGARHFMRHLVDGDLASNQHGWQWTAGCGTDAAPFHRVFNPLLQGVKFDPSGDYVRRYVAELSTVEGAAVHEPWRLPDGVPDGYPERIVDHGTERAEALRRYAEVTEGDGRAGDSGRRAGR
jgi:deoxyribodipyrimidine photo-lyase